ncbi:hypothetical protein [Vibrio phage phiKT1024]|nr:hypothetical protein [Vibrio phage phiKT1024]
MTEEESDFKELEENYTKVDIKPWHFLKIIGVRTPVYLWCNMNIFYDADKGVFHITNEVNFIIKILLFFIIPFVLLVSLAKKDMDPKVELSDFGNLIFHKGSLNQYQVDSNDLVNDKDVYKELIKVVSKKHPELVI